MAPPAGEARTLRIRMTLVHEAAGDRARAGVEVLVAAPRGEVGAGVVQLQFEVAGAVAGCFVHARHARSSAPRFAGWWGHDQATRFRMGPHHEPTPGADGWQLSNPPILALAPLRVSLDVFHRAGIARLREKSRALTGYLARLIGANLGGAIDIVTPREAERRGCQLSLRVKGPREAGRSLFQHLNAQGIVVDWREPDVIRAAPVPLYNRHIDCLRFARSVQEWSALA